MIDLVLQGRFMLITSAGLLVVVLCIILLVGWFEFTKVEQKLLNDSTNELSSLDALVIRTMERHGNDLDDLAVSVFNRWFERQNTDYPGKLWSVWSPQVSKFMASSGQTTPTELGGAPKRADKPPLDAMDEEVLRTGRPIGRFVPGAFRYSLPVVLGTSPSTSQTSCHQCHGAMMIR